MANSIKVIFEAIDKTQGAITSVSAGFNKLKSAAMGVVLAITGIAYSIKRASDAFTNYSDQVKAVGRITGSTTEESSKLIQVTDDLFISYENLAVAMKGAVQHGIEPTIENLAKMSDAYLALAPGLERSAFLLDNFGRSGLEMGKMMEKGGEGIRAMADAIPEGLILSAQDVATADALKVSFDNLGDAAKAAGNGIMVGLAPAIIALVDATTAAIPKIEEFFTRGIQGWKDFGEGYKQQTYIAEQLNLILEAQGLNLRTATDAQYEAAKAQAVYFAKIKFAKEATDEFGNSTKDASESLDELTESEQALIDAFEKAKTAANMSLLGFVTGAQDMINGLKAAQTQYTESMNLLNAQLAAGEISAEEYAKKVGEIEGAYDAAKQASSEWVKQFIVDMFVMMKSVDGLFSDEDFQALLSLMTSMGMLDPKLAELVQGVVNAASSGDEAALKAATDLLNAYIAASGVKPPVISKIPFEWGTPSGKNKEGENIYPDEVTEDFQLYQNDYDAWLVKHGLAPANLPTTPLPVAEPALAQYVPGERGVPGELYVPPAADILPTPSQAAGAGKAADGMERIGIAINSMSLEAIASLKALMESVSGVTPEGLDEALDVMKELFRYNGKTIVIYTTNYVTTVDVTGDETGAGGTAGATGTGGTTTTTGGTTFINYGDIYPQTLGASDIMAELR